MNQPKKNFLPCQGSPEQPFFDVTEKKDENEQQTEALDHGMLCDVRVFPNFGSIGFREPPMSLPV